MNVEQITKKFNLSVFCISNEKAEILNYYAGDLLDVVMTHAKEGTLWLTVMNDVNVAATAKLTNMAAVLFCEGTIPNDVLLSKSKQQGIALLGTNKSIFDMAAVLSTTKNN